MLQHICRTVGATLAVLGLASTLAMAQTPAPGQTMTCTKVDPNGYCVEAKGKDDKTIVIKTEGVKVGEQVSCTTSGSTMTCEKVKTAK